MSASAVAPGFADPVLESQAVFRAVLDACSRPGSIHDARLAAPPPVPLMDATAAIGLTLFDMTTAVWIDPVLASRPARDYLAFHTGCAWAESPAEAAFAILDGTAGFPAFSEFPQGSAEYPDRSATLVFQVESLQEGEGVTLTGPGIDGVRKLAVGGMTEGFWRQLADNRQQFPLGVDVILVAKARVAGLPRTTRAEV